MKRYTVITYNPAYGFGFFVLKFLAFIFVFGIILSAFLPIILMTIKFFIQPIVFIPLLLGGIVYLVYKVYMKLGNYKKSKAYKNDF